MRLEQEPFPLYPGEKLQTGVTPLQVVARNAALRLVAKRDFVQGTGDDAIHQNAGDMWLFEGPGSHSQYDLDMKDFLFVLVDM